MIINVGILWKTNDFPVSMTPFGDDHHRKDNKDGFKMLEKGARQKRHSLKIHYEKILLF